MNSLLATLWRFRYSPLPYLIIAALLALAAFSLLAGGGAELPSAPSTLRGDSPSTVINRSGIWIHDPTSRNGYVKVQ